MKADPLAIPPDAERTDWAESREGETFLAPDGSRVEANDGRGAY